ncbi:unnamed protein product [Closterium sp. NIES-53]
MAAQELRWLTYPLTDLGDRPRSPPVLYIDNKARIALCEDQRLEHRTKHILRYFLTQELQQRGQLRLAYVAIWANTADVITKALWSSDHHHFCAALKLVPTLPHLLRCEFSFNQLRDFCRGEGILQSVTLLDSPQQNGIAEHRIGLVMEVARTSMIHAAASHFLWSFLGRYAAHQLGDASVFRVWGFRAFVHDTSADKLSAHAIFCVFLGFVPDAPGWQFYHPTSRRVLRSQDVTFDESVPFYRLFPYRSAPPPPPPLFLAPGPPLVDPLPPRGPSLSSVSQVDPLLGTPPVEVAVGSGAAPCAASGGAVPGGADPGVARSEGAGSGGAEPGGEELGGAEPEGVEPGGAESEGAESGGAEPRGAASSGGASPRLSPQLLREWLVRRAHLQSGAPGAGGAGDTGAGGARVTAGVGETGGTTATSPGGARTRGAKAAGIGGVGGAGAGDTTEPRAAGAGGSYAGGAGTGGAGARGAGVGDPGAGGAGGTVRLRPYFVPLLQQVLGVPSSTGLTPPLLCPLPDHSQTPLQPASPLPAPSPYTEWFGGHTEHREPASCPVSPVRTARRVPRLRPPPVPGMHAMALRPSAVPLRVPLPSRPESSLPHVPDLESDRACAASATVSRLLATAVTVPSFECAAASALVAELLDFAACCLDYTTALVAECASASPPSVGGECALGTDVLEDRQEDFECLVTTYEDDWDEQNVDGASEEAGPLPYCSVPIPMDDENPRESINTEFYYDFADNGYVTPHPVNKNVSERIGPNLLPDPEAGDEEFYPKDPNLPRYTQIGLQILGLVTAVHGAPMP